MKLIATRGSRQIYHHDTCYGCPALPALADYNAEMYRLGFNDAWIQMALPGDRVVWTAEEGQLTAMIVYQFWGQDSRVVHIMAAWVPPAYRGLQPEGFRRYDELFGVLAEYLRDEHGIARIASGTHVNNHAAQAAFARQGRQLGGLHYNYDIPPAVEPTPPPNLLQRAHRGLVRWMYGDAA